MATRHLVLAGDSIFDNDGYVPGEAGLIEQMRGSLPSGWSSSKVAVDGDCITHVKDQIVNLPSNATDLIVSVGGNDTRQHSGLLSRVQHPNDLIELLRQSLLEFRTEYRDMLDLMANTQLRLRVCTIYTAIPFDDPVWRQFAPSAIGKFNEVIIEEAAAREISVLKLDEVCVDPGDFSAISPIEPSHQGGQKIVDHIISILNLP